MAEWFAEYNWRAWDRQIEEDVAAGKLDALIREATEQYNAGECGPLP